MVIKGLRSFWSFHEKKTQLKILLKTRGQGNFVSRQNVVYFCCRKKIFARNGFYFYVIKWDAVWKGNSVQIKRFLELSNHLNWNKNHSMIFMPELIANAGYFGLLHFFSQWCYVWAVLWLFFVQFGLIDPKCGTKIRYRTQRDSWGVSLGPMGHLQ